jgi:hypothetical protein
VFANWIAPRFSAKLRQNRRSDPGAGAPAIAAGDAVVVLISA